MKTLEEVGKKLKLSREDAEHVKEVVYDGKDGCYGAVSSYPSSLPQGEPFWFAYFTYDNGGKGEPKVKKCFAKTQKHCHFWLRSVRRLALKPNLKKAVQAAIA